MSSPNVDTSLLTDNTKFFVTFFPHVSARFKEEKLLTTSELKALYHATAAPQKDLLPLIKLARFGAAATKKGCLRHDRNVLALTGIEGDYDGGMMSFEAAADLLKTARIKCFLYTSPSHTPEKPRWRVLCPFGREIGPKHHAQMVARLNGVLGGVLSTESFTLSQSYFFGHVTGAA